MARLAATASLAVLLVSFLAVANCRVLEAEQDADVASSVLAISDEQGPSNPAIAQEAPGAAELIPSFPTVAVDEGFLRLPSHRRHRHPCRHGFLHRHLWWARHHGLSHRHGGFPGPGETRVDHPAVVPTELASGEETRELVQEEEVKAVAEPDPDSRPDTDGEQVVEEETKKPFHSEEENETLKAWKGETLRRIRHGLRFHQRHHLRRHHEHDEEDDDHHEQDKEGAGGMNMKRFHHFHHHGDEEEETTRMRFHHHDSDNEVDEVEELARRLSKAIMRRSFSHGRRRHHHHHADEAEKEAEGGVKKWFKGLMNRF